MYIYHGEIDSPVLADMDRVGVYLLIPANWLRYDVEAINTLSD